MAADQTKTSKTVTIPAGESVSTSADLTGGALAMLIFPTDWTPANVSFQVSADNLAFSDLYDSSGVEVRRNVVPGSAVIIDTSLTQAAMYMRLRSGPASQPKAQAADRVLTLVLI